MPRHFRGPALIFLGVPDLRDYAQTLTDSGSRMVPELPRLLGVGAELEAMVGPVDVVFGHNDLLPANFIDDGKRLWLIDWDYAASTARCSIWATSARTTMLSRRDEKWLLEAISSGR